MYDYMMTPIGKLAICSSGDGICKIDNNDTYLDGVNERDDYIDECIRQLDLYFSHKLKKFNVKIDVFATHFQRLVYNKLLEIPYGHYMTYGQISNDIGMPKAARAVGNALNKNPIPIIIPCHRVLGVNGKLTGFRWGLEVKSFLLRHEGIDFKN